MSRRVRVVGNHAHNGAPVARRATSVRVGKLGLATLALPLLLGSAGAGAAWPWQAQTGFDAAWCKGFVAAGLASEQVADDDRTALWLAWNYTIRHGAAGQLEDIAAYREGAARFAADMTAEQVQTVLDQADGDCGLGRSGYQVTGW
ncbi:MAG: hypothetical protein KDI09_20385 [Halioglobus sp.]|nr:hypothetical protein [Halioglobus sp.]